MNRRARRAHRKFVASTSGASDGLVRLSSIVRLLRRRREPEAAAAMQRFGGAFSCSEHGELDDPVIVVVPRADAVMAHTHGLPRQDVGPDDGSPFVACACPWCSSPDVLAQWEREGMVS